MPRYQVCEEGKMLPWGKGAEVLRRAEEILSSCCEMLSLPPKAISKSGREWIRKISWEDDAEMRRAIFYAALVSPSESIEAVHFPPRRWKDGEIFAEFDFKRMAIDRIMEEKISHFFERLGKVSATGLYRTVIRQVERPLIEECLKWSGGNQMKAAQVLGINRNTLRKKMKEFGLE
ncbi:MAG TPA: helix-turn-helix domain-containing protein [bacterium]|mgnify:FL=1|jgi:two-component system nitrogen regulation response regulator GlnG|nr:hypothetical protein [Myxococcales bacterium]HPW44937.1 helix-turn-helix domain-containing protein [bacterium]HQC50893.1 helix-turn-helix domain-containing protein [bacterium]